MTKKSLMKSKSYYMFISKMKNDLYNMGYDKELIEEILSNINYTLIKTKRKLLGHTMLCNKAKKEYKY